MQKWEYFRTVSMTELNLEKLNQFGSVGWELVSVVTTSIAWSYYFKRRVG